MKHLVITVIGQDRPGLVGALSDTVYQHQGNWLGSSMSKLAGQFAGILQVDVPEGSVKSLRQAMSKLDGLNIHIAEDSHTSPAPKQLQTLTVTGNDRPGIVKEVTTRLSELGINIYKLKTDTHSAPNWGYPIFTAWFELEIPASLSVATVQQQLESLADDLTIDFEEPEGIEVH
ncbi:glycine cleavage system protein R [Photobacterium galatheae]|uniref:Glycine cleavage system transcriptional repressor n=1 Tax=Photobacterium galatheae TaxID=1654360 RepID=A0A066RWX5_9GAMM|nr:ACT domain-containing protein [Photobacterium galatheae]KDM91903.1 amino acid-binding protein [Photobacterium galatheae]MCM0147683.1 amino acid-binding protein [Photobacterium galatheae]